MNSLFSAPQPTIAAAVQLHDAVPFNPAAVFQTDAGFVYCRLHTMAADEGAPPQIAGHTLVAHCDAAQGVWRMEER